MFGLGAGELILIAVVALLFVGPDKLPAAAKAIGKGIRDLRRQTSDLTRTIEQDTQIGDAVRDLRSALRGEDPAPPPRPRPPRPPASDVETAAAPASAPTGDEAAAGDDSVAPHGAAAPEGPNSNDGPNDNDDGPVARGPARRTAPADVSDLAGLSTGTLRDRSAATESDANDPEPSGEPGSGPHGAGSGSAHG